MIMTINDIKAAISAKTGTPCLKLSFTEQLDAAGAVTEWVSHWDADTRVRVNCHREVFDKVKANPSGFDGLALKPMEKVAAHTNEAGKQIEGYTRFMLITPKSILGEF